MELLAAMMAGAVGAALLRGALGLVTVTGLGIVAGAAAFHLLALVGPGLNAGPIALVHAGAGAALGAGLAWSAGALRRRLTG